MGVTCFFVVSFRVQSSVFFVEQESGQSHSANRDPILHLSQMFTLQFVCIVWARSPHSVLLHYMYEHYKQKSKVRELRREICFVIN